MHGTAVPRSWASLEPYFTRVSHSRPAHSSHGLKAYLQLAFPCKPWLHAFRRILCRISVQSHALGSGCSTHSHAIRTAVACSLTNSQATLLRAHPHNNTMEITRCAIPRSWKLLFSIRMVNCIVYQPHQSVICRILSDMSGKYFSIDVSSCQPSCEQQKVFPIPSENYRGYIAPIDTLSWALILRLAVLRWYCKMRFRATLFDDITKVSGDFLDNKSILVQETAWWNQTMTWCNYDMMTSSNRNILRVSDPLWWGSMGHWWIPFTKANCMEFWCFLWCAPGQTIGQKNRDASDLRRHHAHYDLTVMAYITRPYWYLTNC